ncbi:MAG: AAA family ATPase [Bacteroidales bacterium]|nr:AAA family ATPase [Bacteroidales bacterium]MCF8333366.1 AAA family ATPase [Bacteroidales bacterium]
MIPQTLTIKGLYSYQKEQTIDFTKLLEGQLFGIFGSVGSGKSSILEAITFALYGETDRLNKKDNRNYNMMNLKSNELKIDFIFKNYDDKAYRFYVQSKRHGKDFDTVRSYSRNAYVESNGNWEPLGSITADSITGLTYDNFRRTIIIPQGKFQEFLQLSDKDRTQMMKEIFNLEKYEFYSQTTSLEKKNNERKSNLEGKLSHYADITKDSLKEKEEYVEKLAGQWEEKEKKVTGLEEELKKLEKLKELFDELQQKKQHYDQLQKQQLSFEKREKQLQAYEKAQRDFKNTLDQIERLQKDLEQDRKKGDEEKKALDDKKKTLEEKQQKFEEAEQKYNQLDKKKREKEDYELWIKVIAEKEKLAGLEESLAKGEKEVQKVTKAKEELEKQMQKSEKELEELKKQLPDQAKLTELKTWFTSRNNIIQNKQQSEKDIQETQDRISESRQKLPELIPSEIAQKAVIELSSDSEKVIQALISYYGKLEQDLDEVDKTLEHLQLQHKLEEFTDALKQGKPCPLCGATEHPDIMDVENVNEKLKESRQKRKELKEEMKKCNELIPEVRSLQSEQKQLQQSLDKAKTSLLENEKKLEEHYKIFRWEEYSSEDEKQVDNDLKKASELNQQIKEKEKAAKEQKRTLDKETEKLHKYEQRLQEVKNQRLQAKSNVESYTGQLKILKAEDLPGDAGEAERKKKALTEEIQRIEQNYKQLQQDVQKLNEQRVQLETSLEKRNETIAKNEKELAGLKQTLNEKLEQSDFTDLESIREILKKELDVEKERNEINRFRRDLYAAQKDLETLQEKIKDREFEEELYQKAKKELEEQKRKFEELKEQHTKARHELEELRKNLKEKEAMEAELEKLKKRAENLAVLKQLFKGSGFVNYVSSVYLQNLCEAANQRFYKLTRQQMQLEVDENNNFKVRDFLNNGRVRSVKTLSGGQTFQASLSLALALAESVQQQNQAQQNFFFLDEGFGTLDKEALQTVFDTLKSLRNENRVVGVISHVEEMQQEIDMYIRIHNDPEEGSLVYPSWRMDQG